MLVDKISHSLSLIQEALTLSESPVVAWSSGKDSQVLLWLVQQVKADIPLVFFRNADDPVRFAFADEFLATRNLTTFIPQPEAYDIVANGDDVELMTVRSFAPQSYGMCGIGIDENAPVKRCGLEVINRVPAQPEMSFDCVFIGHRSDDICPVQGAIPLASSQGKLANSTLFYILKDWTDADVWECIREYDIPVDPKRYDIPNGKEWADKTFNPDYDGLCVNCVKPTLSGMVPCALAGQTESIAHLINPEDRAKRYRSVFINLTT